MVLAPEEICYYSSSKPKSCAIEDEREMYQFDQEGKTCVVQSGCLEHFSTFKTKLECLEMCSGKLLTLLIQNQQSKKLKFSRCPNNWFETAVLFHYSSVGLRKVLSK